MSFAQQHTDNAQQGHVLGGAIATLDNNESMPKIVSRGALHPDLLSGDSADADADADADPDGDGDDDDDVGPGVSEIMLSSSSSSSAAVAESSNVCRFCSHSFPRPCDLNRHIRKHTRPHKCHVPGCPYVQRGFPTSQDLQRHINDRHSTGVSTFRCRVPRCKYKSKRESNLRQHKENKHGLVYNRTRRVRGGSSGGEDKPLAKQEEEDLDLVDTAAAAASSTLSSTAKDSPARDVKGMGWLPQNMSNSTTPVPDVGPYADFILYPSRHQLPQQSGSQYDDVAYFDSSDHGIELAAAASSSLVPWESPSAQQEEMFSLLPTITPTATTHPVQPLPPRQGAPHVPAFAFASPAMHAGWMVNGNQAQRSSSASVYPPNIGFFTPADYRVDQMPLPVSVPGSDMVSASIASGYTATFSPPMPGSVNVPHLLNQQPLKPQDITLSSPQARTAMMYSNTDIQRQLLQQQFEMQSAATRGKFRAQTAQAAAAGSADAEVMQPPVNANMAIYRGGKRTHDAYRGSANDNEDAEQDDDRPPPRRQLHATRNGINEADGGLMPCPYHDTHPGYFNRENEERFSPCHTRHRHISTLIRHIKRAAHKLSVEDKSISSFGVHEPGNWHQPQAGLCRRCWASFTDEPAFQAHTEGDQTCVKAARKKREEYDHILRTFCAPTPTPVTATGPLVARPPPSPAARIPVSRGQPASRPQPVVPVVADSTTRAAIAHPRAMLSVAAGLRVASHTGSPHVKASPTQEDTLVETSSPDVRSPSISLGKSSIGRAMRPHRRPPNKKAGPAESMTLIDAHVSHDWVSRSEVDGWIRALTQRIVALEARVQIEHQHRGMNVTLGSINSSSISLEPMAAQQPTFLPGVVDPRDLTLENTGGQTDNSYTGYFEDLFDGLDNLDDSI